MNWLPIRPALPRSRAARPRLFTRCRPLWASRPTDCRLLSRARSALTLLSCCHRRHQCPLPLFHPLPPLRPPSSTMRDRRPMLSIPISMRSLVLSLVVVVVPPRLSLRGSRRARPKRSRCASCVVSPISTLVLASRALSRLPPPTPPMASLRRRRRRPRCRSRSCCAKRAISRLACVMYCFWRRAVTRSAPCACASR
jgi:hypothetical protein